MIIQKFIQSWKNWTHPTLYMSPHPLRLFKSSNKDKGSCRHSTLSMPISIRRRLRQHLPCSIDTLSLLTSNRDNLAVVIFNSINLQLQVSLFQSLFPKQLLLWVVCSWLITKLKQIPYQLTSNLNQSPTCHPIRKSSRATTHSCLSWWFYNPILVNFLLTIKRGL